MQQFTRKPSFKARLVKRRRLVMAEGEGTTGER
jgi:hypothetical protein